MITSFIVLKRKGAGKFTANRLTTKPAFGDPEISITEPQMLPGKNRFWETAFQTCDPPWRQ